MTLAIMWFLKVLIRLSSFVSLVSVLGFPAFWVPTKTTLISTGSRCIRAARMVSPHMQSEESSDVECDVRMYTEKTLWGTKQGKRWPQWCRGGGGGFSYDGPIGELHRRGAALTNSVTPVSITPRHPARRWLDAGTQRWAAICAGCPLDSHG